MYLFLLVEICESVIRMKFLFQKYRPCANIKKRQAKLKSVFLKGCHHPGGDFFYWAHVTSLTCKVNVQSTTHELIIAYTNHKYTCIILRRFHWQKSLLAPSFEPVTFRPRSSLICSRSFLKLKSSLCGHRRWSVGEHKLQIRRNATLTFFTKSWVNFFIKSLIFLVGSTVVD